MSELIDKLLCNNVKQLTPYESARRLFAQADGKQQQVWLNANESPFCNSYSLDDERFSRYPDCQPAQVVNRYAQYAGLDKSQTLVTRGADEGIELLIRAFCEPGRDSILICPPTYGMYAISAHTCNVGVETVPLNADFSLDVDSILVKKDEVKLVFICSPNNPTGTSVDAQQLDRIVAHFADSALVVVDEAYIEFDQRNSYAKNITQRPNLVVLRTLSKAFALAGIRCGFTLAQSDIIQALLKVIAPYPIPEPVAQIAAQALSDSGLATMHQQVLALKNEQQTLLSFFKKFNQIELVGETKANFILFRTSQKTQLMTYLVNNNLLIRDQSKQPQLQDCLRITIGNQQQNELLMTFVSSFFNAQESE